MVDIRHAAKFAMYNKKEVLKSIICGCFHCLAVFDPKEIKEWTDNEETAVCPFCYVDAILPETDDIHLDKDMLSKLNAYWF